MGQASCQNENACFCVLRLQWARLVGTGQACVSACLRVKSGPGQTVCLARLVGTGPGLPLAWRAAWVGAAEKMALRIFELEKRLAETQLDGPGGAPKDLFVTFSPVSEFSVQDPP